MNYLFLQIISPFPLLISEFTRGDILEIHSLGIKHNLFPLAYGRLQKMKKVVNPKEIDNYLEGKENLYLRSISRSARQEALGGHVLSILANSGIPALVLRGNEIAREIYGDPNMRISSDVDILIKMSDALQADSILSKAGYHRNDILPLEFWFYRIHHAAYSDPETGDLIEIHWCFSIPSFFELSSEEIWDRVLLTDYGQYKLLPEMFMIMLLIHHHMHSFRELRILVDILWAFHKYEDVINWEMFLMRIKRIGLIKTTRITLNQIQMLWKESAEEISPIRILLFELKQLRLKGPGLLLSLSQMDIERDHSFQDYRDKLIARLALDNFSTMVFSFVKVLFPVTKAIKALYNDKRNWTLPFNYLKFIRWRLKEWRGV